MKNDVKTNNTVEEEVIVDEVSICFMKLNIYRKKQIEELKELNDLDLLSL